jgi:hypothetical protein
VYSGLGVNGSHGTFVIYVVPDPEVKAADAGQGDEYMRVG